MLPKESVAVVLAGGVAGVLGLLTLKNRHPVLHYLVAEREDLAQRQPAIAQLLSRVAEVADPSRMSGILGNMDTVLTLAAGDSRANQWHIARLNGSILREAHHACSSKSIATLPDEVFESIVLLKEEYLPELERLLDNLLHNHLLARR